MASELVTRAPLLQRQPRTDEHSIISSHEDSGRCHTTQLRNLASSSTFSVTKSDAAISMAVGNAPDTCSIGRFPYVYTGGFRYHIRRPVESWKFVETRKQDGSMLYLCRICHSSYKHKKSLNKHWKDKHSDVPRPDGSRAEDEDEDEDEDEESDTEGHTVNTATTNMENNENVHPSHLVPLGAYGNQQLLSGQSQSTVTQLRNSHSHPGLLTSRRLSAPLRRVPNKQIHLKRMSFTTQRGNCVADCPVALERIDQDSKKRIRPDISPPSGLLQPLPIVPSVSTKTEPCEYVTGDPMAKRRLSHTHTAVSSPCHLNMVRPFSSANRNEASLSTFRDPPMLCTVPGGLGSAELPFAHVSSSSTPGETGTLVEPQPLDLSLTKSPEQHHSKHPVSSTTVQKKNRETKQSSVFSRSLLIGLLQTALNTLSTETRRKCTSATVDEDDEHEAFLHLSHTSTSLLFAIGTLLVALVNENKDDGAMNEKNLATISSLPSHGCELSVPLSACLSAPLDERSDRHLSLPPALSTIGTIRHSSSLDQAESRRKDEHTGGSGGDSSGNSSPFGKVNTASQLELIVHPSDSEKVSQVMHGVVMPQSHHSGSVQETDRRPSTSPQQPFLYSPFDKHCVSYSENAHFYKEATTYGRRDVTVKTSVSSDEGQKFTGPNEHSRSSDQNDEGSISCPVCQFDARWFSELRAHMVNHSEHRMFGCCYCPYRAKWKWDVAKHMRRCPLGRHVAHLSNESLLRIVRYYAPPHTDILYSYFPQDGFPGVGVDKPPPIPAVCYPNTSIKTDTCITEVSSIQYKEFSMPSVDVLPSTDPQRILSTSPCQTQTSLSCGTSFTSEHSGTNQLPRPLDRPVFLQYESGPDEGYCDRLTIVEGDVEPVSQATTERTSSPTSSLTSSCCVDQSNAPVTRSTELTHSVPSPLEAVNPAIVFRLRKCPACAFHSSDESELLAHERRHCTGQINQVTSAE